MSTFTLAVVGNPRIQLAAGEIPPEAMCSAASEVNSRLRSSRETAAALLDIFDVIDLRMLSGLLGELFSAVMAANDERLLKNPNLDGYPDLCDVSNGTTEWTTEDFMAFPSGGLEVKNTFGTKRQRAHIEHRATRRGSIQRQLVWKAHHRTTNNLIALQSDYIDGLPQIVAGFFASNLTEDDWTEKQQPAPGSTMTSFCQTRPSAFAKLRDGVIFANEHYTEVA